jgi:hypothetical protein
MSCRDDYTAHTEVYKGYTIEIVNDRSPQNPFEAFDGEPPIAIYYDGGIHEYATKYGNANSVPRLTQKQITKHSREILDLLHYSDWKAFRLDRYNSSYGRYDRAEYVHDALNELVDNEYESKRLPLLETVWRMAGHPALYGETTGYSQSDWAYVLVVATPKFLEATGCTVKQLTADDYAGLQASIDLYGYWAWGDVYGFVIKDAKGNELDDFGSSVWGFYGDYPGYGGSLEEARSFVDTHIEYQKKAAR